MSFLLLLWLIPYMIIALGAYRYTGGYQIAQAKKAKAINAGLTHDGHCYLHEDYAYLGRRYCRHDCSQRPLWHTETPLMDEARWHAVLWPATLVYIPTAAAIKAYKASNLSYFAQIEVPVNAQEQILVAQGQAALAEKRRVELEEQNKQLEIEAGIREPDPEPPHVIDTAYIYGNAFTGFVKETTGMAISALTRDTWKPKDDKRYWDAQRGKYYTIWERWSA